MAGVWRKLSRRRTRLAFVDTLHAHDSLTQVTVDEFDAWRSAGCPIPDDLEETRLRYFESLKMAHTTDGVYTLGAFVSRGDPWTRLAVATNPATPPVVLWGDGRQDFGLAADPNPWVRAAVWLREPAPPDHIRAALIDTAPVQADAASA